MCDENYDELKPTSVWRHILKRRAAAICTIGERRMIGDAAQAGHTHARVTLLDQCESNFPVISFCHDHRLHAFNHPTYLCLVSIPHGDVVKAAFAIDVCLRANVHVKDWVMHCFAFTSELTAAAPRSGTLGAIPRDKLRWQRTY